jgi:hypothetical protein
MRRKRRSYCLAGRFPPTPPAGQMPHPPKLGGGGRVVVAGRAGRPHYQPLGAGRQWAWPRRAYRAPLAARLSLPSSRKRLDFYTGPRGWSHPPNPPVPGGLNRGAPALRGARASGPVGIVDRGCFAVRRRQLTAKSHRGRRLRYAQGLNRDADSYARASAHARDSPAGPLTITAVSGQRLAARSRKRERHADSRAYVRLFAAIGRG